MELNRLYFQILKQYAACIVSCSVENGACFGTLCEQCGLIGQLVGVSLLTLWISKQGIWGQNILIWWTCLQVNIIHWIPCSIGALQTLIGGGGKFQLAFNFILMA